MWQVQSMIALHEVLTNLMGALFEVSRGSGGNRLEFFIGHRARLDFSTQQLPAEQRFQSRTVLVHKAAAT